MVSKINKYTSKNSGFTLIELLVSMVVSAILLTTVLSSFWALLQTNDRNKNFSQLQQETSFAMARIADKIKNYSIDYDAYTSPGVCQGMTINDTLKVLCLNSNTFELDSSQETLKMNGQPLFSKSFKVEKSLFQISPAKNPYYRDNIGKKEVQLQPKVTIILKVSSIKYPNMVLNIQTTISSRQYK